MKSQVLSTTATLPTAMLRELANACMFGEIPNSKDSVRHHIFWFGDRDINTGKTQKSFVFVIYQTRRHGPQNGYRLCLVHEGFYIASPKKEQGEPEDDIDALEKEIPQGHEEMAILGEPIIWDDVEDDNVVFEDEDEHEVE